MAEIRWAAEAERWLRDIFDYIAEDNPAAAASTVEGIFDRAKVLRVYPEIGYRYDPIQDRHVRIFLFGHYRITYLLKPDGNIDILGVFHGALDIARYLL